MSVTTFEGRVLVHTGAAVLFEGVYWDSCLWLPRSQIEIESDGDEYVVLKLRDWLARKKDLLEFTHYGEAELQAMNEI